MYHLSNLIYYNLLCLKLFDLTKVNLAGNGSYKNLLIITLFYKGSFIFLYLFKNSMMAILFYSRARCFPIQFLGPPEKPNTANAGKLYLGSLKYLGLY